MSSTVNVHDGHILAQIPLQGHHKPGLTRRKQVDSAGAAKVRRNDEHAEVDAELDTIGLVGGDGGDGQEIGGDDALRATDLTGVQGKGLGAGGAELGMDWDYLVE